MAVLFRRGKRYNFAERIVGAAGQQEFILQSVEFVPGRDNVDVYINGLYAYPEIDYTIPGPNRIVLSEPLPEEAELLFVVR